VLNQDHKLNTIGIPSLESLLGRMVMDYAQISEIASQSRIYTDQSTF